jgi:amino acid permease
MSTSRGIFLFSSTIVGAGILALPVVAWHAGFLPLAAMLVAIGVLSSFSGLYIAEAVLAHHEDVHLATLAERHLGTWGMVAMLVATAIYIYGALVGYLAAGGQIFQALSGGAIPVWVGTLLYFAIGSVIVHRGMSLVGRINSYAMYVMLSLLAILMAMAAPNIKVPFLYRSGWSSILDVFGVVLFAYLGHSVIPSIASSLGDKKRIVVVISLGIALPCVLYLLWALVVLGVVPGISDNGPSLAEADAAGQPSTIPLGVLLGGSIVVLGNVFAALSTLTSYMGFGASLKDSYLDLASQRSRPLPGLALTILVVGPPLLVALLLPGVFVDMLDIAGTFGGGLFVGILPVLIVLRLRRSSAPRPFTTGGGALIAYLVLGIYAFGMVYTAARLAGLVP